MSEDNVVDLNTEILIGIRNEIVGLRTELRDEIRGLGTRIETLEVETIRGFTAVRGELTQVNRRLDNLVELTGTGHRDHEARIAALETAVTTLRRPRARR